MHAFEHIAHWEGKRRAKTAFGATFLDHRKCLLKDVQVTGFACSSACFAVCFVAERGKREKKKVQKLRSG